MDKLTQLLKYIYAQDFDTSEVDLRNTVMKFFGDLIGKDHFIISRVNETDINQVTSSVFYSKGKFLQEFTYKLNESLYKKMSDGSLCIYKYNVQKLLPGEDLFIRLNVDSYMAIPLLTSAGDFIGLIAVMDSKPLSDNEAEEIAVLLKVISVTIISTMGAESPLTKSLMLKQRYKRLFENAPVSIFLMDPYNIFDCNPFTQEMFECRKEDIIGKSPVDFSPLLQPDGSLSSDKADQYIKAALIGSLNTFEWTHKTKNGKEFFAEVTLSKIDMGSKTYLQAIVHNITERKRSTILIQQERDFAEMLINFLPGSFFLYDITDGIENSKLIKRNRWFSEKLGYSEEEIKDMRLESFFSDSQQEKLMDALRQLIRNRYYEIELDILHRDGYSLPYLFHAFVFEQDNSTYFVGFGFDISERKYAELAIQASEQRFKNIFNSSSDGILVLDKNFRVLNANHAILKLFDYKYEDVIFQNILDYVPEQTVQILKYRTEAMLSNEPLIPLEVPITTRTGGIIPVEINSKLIQYDGTEGIITVVRDISERKMYEKKLFNSEINAEEKERERFAKELHDGLGPILSTCKIYMYSLSERLEGDKDLLNISNRSLTLIDDALGTIKEIANNLSPHILRNFGLVQAILSFTHNLESVCDLKFEVEYDHDGRLDEILEFGIYRILTELINNTIKHAEASLVRIEIEMNRPKLKVHYSDNGKGFDLKEITDQKKGFGLLNIGNRINKLDGTYSYNTSPGRGINVEIILNHNNSVK